MKKSWIISGLVVVCVLAGVSALILVLRQSRSAAARNAQSVMTAEQNATVGAAKRVRQGRASATDEADQQSGVVGGKTTGMPVDFSAETRALNDALDDDNVEQALKEARRLIQHPDADVRMEVAFALSWIGMGGLPELTKMLTDPDPEVAAEAFNHWRSGLSELESDLDKAPLLGAAAEVLGADISDEMLFDIVMECAMLENEYALPPLVTLLGSVTKPEHKTEVIDAIHGNMNEIEEPSDNEAELVQQVQAELAILREQQAAEAQNPLDQQQTGA
ncbi:MAG: HEAT repeat domain-containing protein, partial [Kiritimatiellae bacterium]|nr:HEAT repeat domain-containing protein [Kiritimatiellia bacterium]